jgi:hypothetical protein
MPGRGVRRTGGGQLIRAEVAGLACPRSPQCNCECWVCGRGGWLSGCAPAPRHDPQRNWRPWAALALNCLPWCWCRPGHHPRGELATVVRAQRELSGPDAAGQDRRLDAGDRLVVAAGQLQRPTDQLAGATVDDRVQVDPAVLRGPHLGHVQVPQRVRAGNAEEPRPAPAPVRSLRLQQPMRAHHPLHRLRLTGRPSSRPASAATIRVPSVGFALATSTMAWSSRPMRPGPAAGGRRLRRRYRACRETPAMRATTAGW